MLGWMIFRNTPVASSVIRRKIPSPARCNKKFRSIDVVRIVSALIVKTVPSQSVTAITMPMPGFSGKGLRRTLTFLACRSLDFVFFVLTFDTSC